ncbi:MAG TPA: nuclear transport factor 2 family protein [Miltoncostaeaceae bacterium]|jgi:ketosteroid isomerase-like protein|nr:nuclear transport factor 2 family protein [Miltoncostaeaceae bacterium]
MATRNAQLVGSIYEALARGDIDAATAALDPDVEWVEPDTPGLPFAGVHRGRDGVVSGVFATVPETWDEFRVEPEELLDDGESVVAIGRFRARAGDRRLDAPFAHVWRVRGGLAAEFRNFTDTAAFVAALERGTR